MEYLDAIPYLVCIGILHLFVDLVLLVYLSRISERVKVKK